MATANPPSVTTFGTEAIRTVREIAAENPDFVYEPVGGTWGQCSYVNVTHDDDGTEHREPGCLLGRMLIKLGLLDIDGDLRDNEMSFKELYDTPGALPAALSTRELAWLMDVQQSQDEGHPWGRAVEMADDADYIRYGGRLAPLS